MKATRRNLIFRLIPATAIMLACSRLPLQLGNAPTSATQSSSPVQPGAITESAPANQPVGLPRFATDPSVIQSAFDSGKASSLFDHINEPEQDELYAPGIQKYTADVKSDAQLDLSSNWCAKSAAILQDNKKHYSATIEVDGHALTTNQLYYYEWQLPAGQDPKAPDGLWCFSWEVLATQWPVGVHHVAERWAFDAPVNDGIHDFAAGEYAIEYVVTVAP